MAEYAEVTVIRRLGIYVLENDETPNDWANYQIVSRHD